MSSPDSQDPFDIKPLGGLSHYGENAYALIKRMILDDFERQGVGLPTYMKLVACYIAPMGVPEDWLAKLKHQTMAKMLVGKTVPRYEFWACLHLYLIRQTGSFEIAGQVSALDVFGQALSSFAVLAPLNPEWAGDYKRDEVSLSLRSTRTQA